MLAALLLTAVPGEIELTKGLVIESSTVVKKGTYLVPSRSETGQVAAVSIQGKGIVVDFQGATLSGSGPDTQPDARQGIGIRVDGEDITIKNATIRGYKVGLVAWKVKGLKLLDCDVSYNWKQRLLSDREKEDGADWMSYHKNEAHEWLRYGAGAYLSECDSFEVKGLRATGGQCGLMLDRSNNGKVWNCDVSFMSGVGLGLYASSGNTVMHNRFDWCVRGYSHGIYNRGQDSTGILVYEQSNNNVFAYNSATHGGDGFFLWAGQTTMDTGSGGCNDNRLYGNDFSHSPANGIEATFSRNTFVNNKLIDCWHGVWGGYSFDTLILGNYFAYNSESIAIEHGQFNRIIGNVFLNDTVSLMLWENEGKPDPGWGYPKFRDTRNVGTVVSDNTFRDAAEAAIELGTGKGLQLVGNRVLNSTVPIRFRGRQSETRLADNHFDGEATDIPEGVEADASQFSGKPAKPPTAVITRGGSQIVANEPQGEEYGKRWTGKWNPWPGKSKLSPLFQGSLDSIGKLVSWIDRLTPAPLEGGIDPFLPMGALRGRKYIIIDEWGPYDFRRPLLWPSRSGPLTTSDFDILGPAGTWKAVVVEGCKLSVLAGTVPGEVKVTERSGTWRVVLEYVGEETTDAWGRTSPAGASVKFGYSEDRVQVAWDVAWFVWEAGKSDPRENKDSFEAVIGGTPVATARLASLDFATSGSPSQGVPADYFATVARGEFSVPAGTYVLEVTTDDGVRVSLDGETVINEWKYQGPTTYSHTATLAGGRHTLRVEHFEINGYTALKFKVRPVHAGPSR